MALQVVRGELIKDKYFKDPRTQIYYDLNIIKRNVKNEDEDGLNARIDKMNKLSCSDKHPFRFVTLFVLRSQYLALDQAKVQQFGAKSYLMIVEPTQSAGGGFNNYSIWSDNFADTFIFVDHDEVYTRHTPNNLSHRYRTANQDEVSRYKVPDVATGGGTSGGSTQPGGGISFSFKKLSIKGSIKDGEVDLFITKEE